MKKSTPSTGPIDSMVEQAPYNSRITRARRHFDYTGVIVEGFSGACKGELLSSKAVKFCRPILRGLGYLWEKIPLKTPQAMFAKVFNSAKRILSRSPSVQDTREEVREESQTSHGANVDMVTSTRRGPVTPQSTTVKTRGKRALDVETPVSSKKRRTSIDILEHTEIHGDKASLQIDEPVLEHPASGTPDANAVRSSPSEHDEVDPVLEKEDNLPIRRRGSPKVIISKTPKKSSPIESVQEELPSSIQGTAFHTPGTHKASSVFETPMTSRAEQEGSPTPKAGTARTSRAPGSGKKRGRRTSVEDTSESQSVVGDNSEFTPTAKRISASQIPDEIPSSTWDGEDGILSTQESAANLVTLSAPISKKEHVRFGSEEPAEIDIAALARPTQRAPVQELLAEGDSDSDDAPEEVTAASALSATRAVEAEAVKALKAQQERERLRKKERAERIAQEQEQKRMRLEKKASEFAKVEAKKQARRRGEGFDLDVNHLPTLLPESILEAAGERRPPTPPVTHPGSNTEDKRKEKLGRHLKFLEQGPKAIEDVKKGSLNVRVLPRQNENLAPKVDRGTKNVRERWLKGREGEKRGKGGRKKIEFPKMQRRSIGGGFLRGED
jgi:U3 small nucleolar RNA-associated protein 16